MKINWMAAGVIVALVAVIVSVIDGHLQRRIKQKRDEVRVASKFDLTMRDADFSAHSHGPPSTLVSLTISNLSQGQVLQRGLVTLNIRAKRPLRMTRWKCVRHKADLILRPDKEIRLDLGRVEHELAENELGLYFESSFEHPIWGSSVKFGCYRVERISRVQLRAEIHYESSAGIGGAIIEAKELKPKTKDFNDGGAPVLLGWSIVS